MMSRVKELEWQTLSPHEYQWRHRDCFATRTLNNSHAEFGKSKCSPRGFRSRLGTAVGNFRISDTRRL